MVGGSGCRLAVVVVVPVQLVVVVALLFAVVVVPGVCAHANTEP